MPSKVAVQMFSLWRPSMANCRNIAMALFEAEKGEAKAHTCDMA
jgi:hypothetical protein